MPAGTSRPSGWYASLESEGAGENVYRPTTVSGRPATSTGLLDGMMKAFGFFTEREEPLVQKVGAAEGPVVIASRYVMLFYCLF